MTRQATSQHGAPSASSLWLSIDWQQIEDDVFRFQVRIARATKAQRWNKVRALQRLLTRSHQAKLLAVKRVTSNRGRNTPGIDGTRWINPQPKWHDADVVALHRFHEPPGHAVTLGAAHCRFTGIQIQVYSELPRVMRGIR
ncbi:reverse transcriptase N-terminal domain-containing protein [Salmonella enterica]|nr:reverse transcriptase N-terminal domain-containing protein [Salmonella enterica]EKB5404064.1 reverse transcriptase N-terminal domain-containing protein [Salmonella enterica]EKB5476140.1 reverse transcriptase N-terminal domain-containing protein [Salmonella enterica]ELL0515344.1 reverse transcriptase N-terminal domain-containing protein [Salmonella enterica]